MIILISYLLHTDAMVVSGWRKQGLAGQNEGAMSTPDLLKLTR